MRSQWFLDLLVEEYDSVMDTDYATLNYITLKELSILEHQRLIQRRINSEKGTDIIMFNDF